LILDSVKYIYLIILSFMILKSIAAWFTQLYNDWICQDNIAHNSRLWLIRLIMQNPISELHPINMDIANIGLDIKNSFFELPKTV
jgi:hypothetical protein